MNATLSARLSERLRRLTSAWRAAWFRATGVELGPRPSVASGADLALGFATHRRGAIRIGAECVLSQGVIVHPHGGTVQIGSQVFLGPYVVIYGHGGVEIGDATLISMHCRILSSNHTVPAPGILIRSQPDIPRPTKIGRDVWLGAGVTVLGGVAIGDGCIVGAGAVVAHDLPPHSVALGVPARVVRSR